MVQCLSENNYLTTAFQVIEESFETYLSIALRSYGGLQLNNTKNIWPFKDYCLSLHTILKENRG